MTVTLPRDISREEAAESVTARMLPWWIRLHIAWVAAHEIHQAWGLPLATSVLEMVKLSGRIVVDVVGERGIGKFPPMVMVVIDSDVYLWIVLNLA